MTDKEFGYLLAFLIVMPWSLIIGATLVFIMKIIHDKKK
jgi:hypothetical protein